jgi:hypothetical protein
MAIQTKEVHFTQRQRREFVKQDADPPLSTRVFTFRAPTGQGQIPCRDRVKKRRFP